MVGPPRARADGGRHLRHDRRGRVLRLHELVRASARSTSSASRTSSRSSRRRSCIGSLGNTLLLAFGFLVFTNVLGLLFALALNRTLKTPLRAAHPDLHAGGHRPIAVSYVWKFIFAVQRPAQPGAGRRRPQAWQQDWLADPTLAIWCVLVVMVWQNIGFVMVIYLAGLATVPVELEEAAALDGAGTFDRFRHIILPMIQPSIAIATTLMLIQGLRVFDQVVALTGGGPAGATQTLAREVYQQAFIFQKFGFGAALALVLSVLILHLHRRPAVRHPRPLGERRREPCSATRRRPSSSRSSTILGRDRDAAAVLDPDRRPRSRRGPTVLSLGAFAPPDAARPSTTSSRCSRRPPTLVGQHLRRPRAPACIITAGSIILPGRARARSPPTCSRGRRSKWSSRTYYLFLIAIILPTQLGTLPLYVEAREPRPGRQPVGHDRHLHRRCCCRCRCSSTPASSAACPASTRRPPPSTAPPAPGVLRRSSSR